MSSDTSEIVFKGAGMHISELAKATGTTSDTLRYYEKEGLLAPASRLGNGYRSYQADAVRSIQFIRSAQTLGFTLAEIRDIIPQLADGRLDRSAIEQRLGTKIAQIDAHIKELRALKKELVATVNSLTCPQEAPLSVASATRTLAAGGKKPAASIKRVRQALA